MGQPKFYVTVKMLSFYMQKLNIFAYICTVKSTDLIIDRINEIGEGIVFTYSDLSLPSEMQSAAAMSLSRMVAENKLKKVSKGKFYKPHNSRLGTMSPALDELMKDLIYKDGRTIGYITGVPAFAQLGLTTQISSQIKIGSKNYRRPFERGGYIISYIKQENEISNKSIPLLRFLDTLRFIKKIPACTVDNAINILLQKLTSFTEQEIQNLQDYSKNYTASTRALLGAMLELSGFSDNSLKATLNPLSTYKVGVSNNILPNKSNWNIL